MPRGTAPGTIIGGRYRLVAHLNSGGFGRVWRAHDERLGIDVAVKEVWLPPASSEQEEAERLVRAEKEARLAVRLRDHPNIVTVHDVVTEDGMPWIIMQLVSGRSLAQRLATDGPLGVEETAVVAAAVLDALDAAHRAGVVHRDITPANILLADNGAILLTDFGIAVDSTDATITQTGMLVGAVEYLAPERIDGRRADAASDLYALGVTLFHAVEGFSPFRRDGVAATLNAVLHEEAPPPQRAGHLASLLTSLMAKDPAHRTNLGDARASLTTWPTLVEQPPPTAQYSSPGFPPPPIGSTPPPVGSTPPPGGPEPPPTVTNPWGFDPWNVGPRNAEPQNVGPGTPPIDPMSGYPTLGVPAQPPPPGGVGTVRKTIAAVLAVAVVAAVVVLVVLQNNHSPNHFTAAANAPTYPAWTPPPYTPAPYPTYPVYTPPTSTAPVIPDLDDAADDTTPLTSAAMLPDSFRDAQNVVYTLRSGGRDTCVNDNQAADVRDPLLQSGCTSMVVGAYVDNSGQILVSVWVVPLRDDATAETTHNALSDVSVRHWGMLCPASGAGSELCDGAHDSGLAAAREYGWTGVDHRYLIHTVAVYINLTRSSSVDPWLDSASYAAVTAAGPENYYDTRY